MYSRGVIGRVEGAERVEIVEAVEAVEDSGGQWREGSGGRAVGGKW